MTKPLASLLVVAGLLLAAAPIVHADALPDGRVYEQVSPVLKNGNDAGAPGNNLRYAMATADGDGLFYGSRGPMGDANRGLQEYTVGRRSQNGWTAVSALPPSPLTRPFVGGHGPISVVPSSDLTSLMFDSPGSYVADNPDTENLGLSGALYIGHADGSIDWLTRPRIPNPDPAPGNIPAHLLQPVGGTPDLSTVYFWAAPTLLPSDAAREPATHVPFGPGAWGLYEYSHGELSSAGTLPDGTEDPGGAAPASTSETNRDIGNNLSAEAVGNQVSRDGETLWFVSPDPGNNPAVGPVTQLYVRQAGHSTLITRLADGSAAPSGAAPVGTLNGSYADLKAHQFAFGSPDGSSAIFQSHDALSADAPTDSSLKSYRYDVGTNTVSYLPGVDGATVVAASGDASKFLFENQARIGLWNNGTITTLFQGSQGQLAPARATASGSVFAFTTQASIRGAATHGTVQVYRYDVARDEATCLSCVANGVGGGTLANQVNNEATDGELIPSRAISDDGSRVFFQSSAPLVPLDTNGQPDVYEWTSSGVSLISTGRSHDASYLLDNSASGNDVFFATTEGLDSADTDGSYDVYDARVGGGFKPADVVTPCESDGCQGSPSGSLSLPSLGSASFFGSGNESSSGDPAAAAAAVKLRLGTRRVVRSSLEVRATVTGPGRVTVAGSGLRSVKESYAQQGTFTLKTPLTAAAKRSLKSKRKLKLSVRVSFAPVSGAASSVKFVLNAKA